MPNTDFQIGKVMVREIARVAEAIENLNDAFYTALISWNFNGVRRMHDLAAAVTALECLDLRKGEASLWASSAI